MRLLTIASLLLLLLVPTVVHADEHAGWQFTPPAGATQEKNAVGIAFTKIDAATKTFCQIQLYSPRASGNDDFASEWQSIVEKHFTVLTTGSLVSGKAKQLTFVARAATIKSSAGTFAAAFYLVQPKGAISSVLLTSSNAKTLAKCPINAFLDSLTLLAAPASAPAQGASPPAPVQAQDTIVGAWSAGAGDPNAQQGTGSTLRRQYVFKSDGTYAYFSEVFNGVNLWIHVREAGTYTISGNQLTVAPTASTISSRDWKAEKGSQKRPLETVTYAFQKVYFSGIQQWNLVLTPQQQTVRDGQFSSNSDYKNSYLLSDTYKPAWKWL